MPVSPNDPLRIKASTWNQVEAMAEANRFGATAAPIDARQLPALRVRARNSSTTIHIDQYAVAHLKQADLDPETVVSARKRPLFEIEPAAWHTSLGSLVIADEPIAAGKTGWVTLSGVAVARVQVVSTGDRAATLDPADITQLRSGPSGEIRIFAPGSTGQRLCMVELGRVQPLWRYKLTADWAAGGTAAILLGLTGSTAWHASAAITLLDPETLVDDQVTDHTGLCLQVGNTFQALNASCVI